MSQLSLQSLISVSDFALPAKLCDGLVADFEIAHGQQRVGGREAQLGFEESAWTEIGLGEVADGALKGYFLNQMSQQLDVYNEKFQFPVPIPFSGKMSELCIKRYRAGTTDRFQVHFDSIGLVANRYLVFLWYLNDVEHGGETYFPQLDVSIAPQRGRLLIFPPYWMYQHQGTSPKSGEKYILSSSLTF